MIENYDLVITTNNIKKEILKKISVDKKIIKTKIVTLQEFKNMTVGTIKKESIIYVMKEFNISYNLAKVYIKNIFYNSDKLGKYYIYLKENKLIDEIIINIYNKILLINVQVDDYLKDYYKNSEFTYYTLENKYNHEITEYKTIEEEISSVANKISDLLKNVSINNIKLVNVNNDYYNEIKKIFNMFNIPINLNDKSSIYKTDTAKMFVDSLKQTFDMNVAIENIPENDIKNKIVNYINTINYDVIDDDFILFITESLQNINLDVSKELNAVECIDFSDIYNLNNYYFVLGLNDGNLPKMSKNEDFFTDEEKIKLKVLTSTEKNNFNKKLFMNIYGGYENLYISYKLNSPFSSYRPSIIIEDNKLPVNKYISEKYKNSNIYNKLELSKYIDNLIKFNEYSDNLEILYSNYKIPYFTYDNKYKNINADLSNITLSYTSINDYYHCAFKYYIKKILKLEESEESLALLIGNCFHYVLSKIYEENFDLKKEYTKYLSEKTLDNKSKIFMDILYDELILIIDVIKSFDRKTTLNANMLEKEVTINDIIPGKVKLYGIVDKLKTNEDKSLCMIVDYKTGSITSSLDNINHGLNLQLPIYIVLSKQLEPNLKVGGFYLQKILNNPKVDEEEIDRRKALKYEGYSISDESLLNKIDSSYENSDVIKSLKMTSKGYSSYSKVLDEYNIDLVTNITYDKIKEAANNILDCKFDINPKKLNNENIGCIYCKFKDLCFMKEEDIIELKYTKLKDVIGGEE